MGKCVAYVAASVVLLGIKALVAGLAVWYSHDRMNEALSSQSRTAGCLLSATDLGEGVSGYLTLNQRRPGTFVHITGNISHLSEGLHGFHIHAWGCAGAGDGCRDVKGHYNPDNNNHATLRHVGDLGNILSENDGSNQTIAFIDIKDHVISLWGEKSIVGRSIVVHAGQDDLGLEGTEASLKTGDAGGRLACCTIYLTPESSM
ncbi:LOW QUALITY PROTEIN: superoxide dismutase [Cu-Zn]-like [Homarus americanus]|uniref:LOW QUALITY PROTEIN: superoxide dismutase [Cu-Zn]-like n=1 Tax=Homarus americanus TaxID=6706 RepID=UPI001C46518E|nr:LOW QUALITY PROTEIN: superoxide dismutase [Cu-Zn]-like [Homarus americanus]